MNSYYSTQTIGATGYCAIDGGHVFKTKIEFQVHQPK